PLGSSPRPTVDRPRRRGQWSRCDAHALRCRGPAPSLRHEYRPMTVRRSPLVRAAASALLLLFVSATVLPTLSTFAAPQPVAQADPSPTPPSGGGGPSFPSIPNPFAG